MQPDGGVDGPPGQCTPQGNIGCSSGNKCTWVIDSELDAIVVSGRTECAVIGSKAEGEVCGFIDRGADGERAYVDDCEEGLWCLGGRCRQVCDLAEDGCGSGGLCQAGDVGAAVFGDIDPAPGLCAQTCDPAGPTTTAQGARVNWPDGENFADTGCYATPDNPAEPVEGCQFYAQSGTATCTPPLISLGHFELCDCPNCCGVSGTCALNDWESPDGIRCVFNCDASAPVDRTGPACPNGATIGQADADFGFTDVASIPYSCRRASTFWTDANTPDNVGVCIPAAGPIFYGTRGCVHPSDPGCTTMLTIPNGTVPHGAIDQSRPASMPLLD